MMDIKNMNSQKILVVDDEIWVRELLYEIIKDYYPVETAENGEQAVQKLTADDYSVVLLDLRMPKLSGMELLARMRKEKISAIPIVITANKDVESAVEAMKLGAYDYVIKPFDNEKVLILIKNALEKYNLQNEVETLRAEVKRQYAFSSVVGQSESMQKVFNLISRVLDNDTTVLITGESGTGKEVIARTIHYNSSRKNAPFVALDCATIPDTLIENELFGHEKGAYTGAMNMSRGKFEIAQGGTLFLDEIGNLRMDVQAKLLRVLQEREFTRIGGNEKVKVDVRILCATNSDLEKQIQQGMFREDLYYRINVVPLRMPPLRERIDDIPLLLDFFLRKFNSELKRSVRLSAEVVDLLSGYSWPGNVRELENMVNRLAVMAEDDLVTATDLPSEMKNSHAGIFRTIPLSKTLEEIEQEYILKILEQEHHNISQASRVLGVSRKTLHNKLNKYHYRANETVNPS